MSDPEADEPTRDEDASAAVTDSGREQLDEAYDRLHAWGPEFGGEGGENGLANHGPMAAEVLARRGLGDELTPWLDRYVARLEELPPESDRITEANWQEAMGRRDRVGDWAAYFARAVREGPWQQVLVEWWPRLLPAIAAGSTHGLIRTGHAVRTVLGGDSSPTAVDEVAYALGYWTARAIYVPGLAAPSGTLDPATALARLPRLAEQRGVIRDRFARLGDLPGWTPALTSLRPPGDDAGVPQALADLAEAGVRQYTTHGQGSPVLLVHVATAPNAMRHVLPALPQHLWGPSFGATWAACAAITVAYAPQEARAVDHVSARDPMGAFERAADHGDEHVIKLTDTVLDVYSWTGDESVLLAAEHCADLIDRPA